MKITAKHKEVYGPAASYFAKKKREIERQVKKYSWGVRTKGIELRMHCAGEWSTIGDRHCVTQIPTVMTPFPYIQPGDYVFYGERLLPDDTDTLKKVSDAALACNEYLAISNELVELDDKIARKVARSNGTVLYLANEQLAFCGKTFDTLQHMEFRYNAATHMVSVLGLNQNLFVTTVTTPYRVVADDFLKSTHPAEWESEQSA